MERYRCHARGRIRATERRQAELLDAYVTALRDDPRTAPPAGLEPASATVAELLARVAPQLAPRPAFVEQLLDDLLARHERGHRAGDDA